MNWISCPGVARIICGFGPCQIALTGQLRGITENELLTEIDCHGLQDIVQASDWASLLCEDREYRIQLEPRLVQTELPIVEARLRMQEMRHYKIEARFEIVQSDEDFVRVFAEAVAAQESTQPLAARIRAGRSSPDFGE